MTGRIKDLYTGANGKDLLLLEVDSGAKELYDRLNGCEVDIGLKKHRHRRSLTANAYAWVLIDKIAAATNQKKEDVYRQAIVNIGGASEIVCVQDAAVDKLREVWGTHGTGWLSDTMPSRIDGCTNVILYYGSSAFDTAQMSRLIDSLIADAKDLGLETMPPDELHRLYESAE